jgi:hypothetical protein
MTNTDLYHAKISLNDLLYKLKYLLKEFYDIDLEYRHSTFADYPIYMMYIYNNDNYLGKVYFDYHYNTTNNIINKDDHNLYTISMAINDISQMTHTNVYQLFTRFNDFIYNLTDLLTYKDITDFIYEM